ncbi:hypothetical protein CGGC5_v003654 [Colletotrichum fructicola Nara gc5]|uniref:Uncharacterized protein n=1 Tax=Colletotrichum fructicola (strain Nara gc5) TaxID=1213859 RepID=A0A7J6JGX2_COLFN|nr:hypothetical protein CGGC5_v003654 [Colletotrichum fructicola Nara gc5]
MSADGCLWCAVHLRRSQWPFLPALKRGRRLERASQNIHRPVQVDHQGHTTGQTDTIGAVGNKTSYPNLARNLPA